MTSIADSPTITSPRGTAVADGPRPTRPHPWIPAVTRPRTIASADGYHLTFLDPRWSPDHWDRYWHGVWTSYARHGVERALEVPYPGHARTASLVALVEDVCGRTVAGVRLHGPYTSVDEVVALHELAAHPDPARVRRMLAAHLGQGLVEPKGGWADPNRPDRMALASTLGRVIAHCHWLSGARCMVGTAADHASPRWLSSGAMADTDLGTVPYPDERYRTGVLWWDAAHTVERAEPSQGRMLLVERARLVGTFEAEAAWS